MVSLADKIIAHNLLRGADLTGGIMDLGHRLVSTEAARAALQLSNLPHLGTLLQEGARGMGWAPGQLPGMGGSRAGYEAYRERYPALEVASAQYGLVPGEAGYTPGMRLTNLEISRRRDEINAEYDARVDALLRRDPTDAEGRRALEDERAAAMAAVGRFVSTETAASRDRTAGALPEMLYGENPVEYAERVAMQEARSVRDTAPKPEDFAGTEGEVDWGAYYEAYDGWMEALRQAQDAPIRQARERLEAVRELGGRYAGLSLGELVEAYGQRSDSPLEAVGKVYRDVVVDGAWDEYRELVAGGMKKGEAYDRTVGAIGPMDAGDLISAVLQTYKAKGWTPAELGEAYRGVVFPSYEEQQGQGEVAEGAGTTDDGRRTTAGQPRGAAPTGSGGGSWMFPGGEGYEEAVERVKAEGWRAVYGEPWWEKYGLVGRAGSWGRPSTSSGWGGGATGGRWIPAGRSYWDRWRPPNRMYGGAFRS